MQPYFLPYIGYFQLICAADEFIVYDNIKYTKKGWINRNRYLSGSEIEYISIPLMSDSDSLNVCDRRLATDYERQRDKILRKVFSAYRNAPHRSSAMNFLERVLACDSRNLFDFILSSIMMVNEYLSLDVEIIAASDVVKQTPMTGQDRVIELCLSRHATEYVNPMGGTSLYSQDVFQSNGMCLKFLRPSITPYDQGHANFVGSLSILDVMMHNSANEVRRMATSGFEVIHG